MNTYTVCCSPTRYVRVRRAPSPEEGFILRLYRLGIYDWWRACIAARQQHSKDIARAHEARKLDY